MKVGKKVQVGQRDEEYAALSFTPHWFAYVIPIASLLLFYALCVFIVIRFSYFDDADRMFMLLFLTSSLVYGVVISLITVNYNVYQVSNRKIFNSRIVLPSKIKKNEVMLDLVKSFQANQSSFASQMLDYGTLRVGVNMSGDSSNMIVRFAPKPQKILEVINSFEK